MAGKRCPKKTVVGAVEAARSSPAVRAPSVVSEMAVPATSGVGDPGGHVTKPWNPGLNFCPGESSGLAGGKDHDLGYENEYQDPFGSLNYEVRITSLELRFEALDAKFDSISEEMRGQFAQMMRMISSSHHHHQEPNDLRSRPMEREELRAQKMKEPMQIFTRTRPVHATREHQFRTMDSATEGKTFFPKIPKLEIPIYKGGDDVLGWLYQIENYFELQNSLDEDKIQFCRFFCKEEALCWWRWWEKQKKGYITWNELRSALVSQFGPSELDDPMGALTKVKQSTSVHEYHKQFIKLCQLVEDISEDHLVSCFVSGLKDELRHDVLMWKPGNVIEAYRLACARESIVLAQRRTTRTLPFKNFNAPISNTTSPTSYASSTPTPPASSQWLSESSKQLPVKKMTQTQLQERRDKGLL